MGNLISLSEIKAIRKFFKKKVYPPCPCWISVIWINVAYFAATVGKFFEEKPTLLDVPENLQEDDEYNS